MWQKCCEKNSVEQTKYKKNYLENKVPDASNLIHTNQYNGDKQNLDKKIHVAQNKIFDISNLVTSTDLNREIGEIEEKDTRYHWFSECCCSW